MKETVNDHLTPDELERLSALDPRTAGEDARRAHLDACARCRRALAEWRALDRELARLGHLEVPQGFVIEVMERCRAELAEWRALDERLAALGHVAPAPGFVAGVMARVRLPVPWQERARAFVRRRWKVVATATASLTAVTGGAFYWLLGSSGVTPAGLVPFLLDGARDLAVQGALGVGRLAYRLGWVDPAGGFTEGLGLLDAVGGLVAAGTLGLLSIWTMYRLMRPAPRLARAGRSGAWAEMLRAR